MQRGLRHVLRLVRARTVELARARHNLVLAFDSVPSILVALTPNGEIVHWNAAAHRTFRLSFEQVRHKRLSTCGIHWLEPAGTLDSLFCHHATEHRSDHPYQIDGQKRWLGISLRNVRNDEQHSAFLLSASDITARREMEEQNRQTHKLEAIGQLAAGIAHEINTPTQYVGDNITFLRDTWQHLCTIIELARTLRHGVTATPATAERLLAFDHAVEGADLDFVLPEFPQALSQALEGTQRIASIVRAMKEFSHPGSNQKTDVDLNRAIDTTIVISRSEWKYVAEVVTRFDASLPMVPCYPGEISQVILNLLVNAAHAIEEKLLVYPGSATGTITLATRRNQNAVEVTVADTGMGIPEAIRPRIFELFFTTKEVGKGTGQGLAFAHSVIVKKHAGDLWFDSEPGVGTTFGFRLPLLASG